MREGKVSRKEQERREPGLETNLLSFYMTSLRLINRDVIFNWVKANLSLEKAHEVSTMVFI